MENIIRSDIQSELLEILELYCELLLARTGLMEAKECDPGLEEAVKSIIYAAPRTEIKELHQARALLVEKYGKDFGIDAANNKDNKVAERVLKKLKVEPPDPELVTLYLKEIARTYNVDWPRGSHQPDEAGEGRGDDDDNDDDEPSGGQAMKTREEPLTTNELSKATPPRDLGPKSPVSIAPPKASTDNVSPSVKLPAPPDLKPGAKMTGFKKQTAGITSKSEGSDSGPPAQKKDVVGGKIPDVDELSKRFAALKK